MVLGAGLVQGGQRTVREGLVVGDGSGIVTVVCFRKERIHAYHLVGDGEPAHLVTGITVGTAGKEPRGLPASHHSAQTGIENEMFCYAGFQVGAHVVAAVVVSVNVTFLSHITT